MIDLSSIAGLHRHQHQLACYCQRCDRWALLDLASMIDAGHGQRRLPITVRCQICGEIGQLQVRPPVPTRGPGGWMESVQVHGLPGCISWANLHGDARATVGTMRFVIWCLLYAGAAALSWQLFLIGLGYGIGGCEQFRIDRDPW